MNQSIRDIKARFLAEAHRKLVEISSSDDRILMAAFEESPQGELPLYVHRVAGLAGSIGFKELGTSARLLEDAIQKFSEAPSHEKLPEDELELFLFELADATSGSQRL